MSPFAVSPATTYIADARRMTTKAGLFDELSRVLRFPDWFGRNFDALNDCLLDLEWLTDPLRHLVIANAARLLAEEDDRELDTFVAILRDAAAAMTFTVELHRPGERLTSRL